eukprot:g23791.t1
MTWLGARLFKHTVVAATIFGSTVLAPFLLLLRKQCGETCIGGALVLLTAGSAALLGAAACRGLDRGSMSTCKWRLVVASVWVFNPVPLAAIGLALRCYEAPAERPGPGGIGLVLFACAFTALRALVGNLCLMVY